MVKRRDYSGLSSFLKNPKTRVVLLFVLLGIGVVAASGVQLVPQVIFGYDDRLFTHVWLGIEVKNSQSDADNTIETAEFISTNPFPGYFNRWHCFYKGYVYFYMDDAAHPVIASASIKIHTLDPATYEIVQTIYSGNLASYFTMTIDGRPVGAFYAYVNEYLGGDAGTGGDIGDGPGVLFKSVWTVTDIDGVQEVYEVPMALFEAPPDLTKPPPGAPDLNLVGPDDFTHIVDDVAVPLTWSWNPVVRLNTIRLTSSIGTGYYTAISGSSWTFDQNDPANHLVIWDGSLGVHVYTFVCTDQYGREYTDTVTVSVEESPIQELVVITSVPDDLTFAEGSLGNTVEWTFIGYEYIISMALWEGDTNLYSYSDAFSGFFGYNVDDLSVGIHTLRFHIVDSNGFEYEDYVVVTVINTAPMLSEPPDLSFEVGTPNMEIWWDLNEENLYAVLVVTGDMSTTFYPNTQLGHVQVVVSGLAVGEYDYTLTVEDIYGASDSDTVHVSVLEPTAQDVTSPILTHPPDVSRVGSASGSIVWIVTDESSGTYEIVIPSMLGDSYDTVLETGTWQSGDSISYSFIHVEVGTYIYEIKVSDEYGNGASDEVTVYVTAAEEPTEPDFMGDVGAFLNQELTVIGDYPVLIWHAIVGVLGLMIILGIGGKRR